MGRKTLAQSVNKSNSTQSVRSSPHPSHGRTHARWHVCPSNRLSHRVCVCLFVCVCVCVQELASVQQWAPRTLSLSQKSPAASAAATRHVWVARSGPGPKRCGTNSTNRKLIVELSLIIIIIIIVRPIITPLSVGHVCQLCKNGCTDGEAFWGGD